MVRHLMYLLSNNVVCCKIDHVFELMQTFLQLRQTFGGSTNDVVLI